MDGPDLFLVPGAGGPFPDKDSDDEDNEEPEDDCFEVDGGPWEVKE